MDPGWPKFPINYFCKIIIVSQIPTEVNLCENLQYIDFSLTTLLCLMYTGPTEAKGHQVNFIGGRYLVKCVLGWIEVGEIP